MANIIQNVANIRAASVGKTVRETIAAGIEAINEEVVSTTGKQTALEDQFVQVIQGATETDPSSVEIETARGGFGALYQRLNSSDAELAEIPSQIDSKIGTLGSNRIFKGSCLNSALPVIPTTNEDYWFVSDLNTNKAWNGASWVDIGNALKIGDRTINPENTSFMRVGKNLFDKNYVTLGYRPAVGTGILTADALFNASSYIPVSASTNYVRNGGAYALCFFTADKVFISGVTTATFTTPVNCAYILAAISVSQMAVLQIELGALATTYEAYKTYLPKETFDASYIPPIGIGSVDSIYQTTFVTLGKNLFDKAVAVAGFINYTNGVLETSASYFASGYMPASALTAYARTESTHIAFYNSLKVYISGLTLSGLTFTTPANCAFIRVSVHNALLNTEQIELGTISTVFEGYRYKFIKNNELVSAVDPINFVLPSIIPAVVGLEVNVYFDNICNVGNINNYQFNCICAKGIQQSERWTYIPVIGDVSAGDIWLTIEIYKDGVYLTKTDILVKVVSSANGTGTNPKLLMIGDSTTANSIMATELNNLFGASDSMDITLLGTKGTAPVKHEAISGWTANMFYTDPTSPFVFSGVFNFATYLTNNALATPDYVTFNLGINDVFSTLDDATVISQSNAIFVQLDAMIANIKLSNANMIFGIAVTIPPDKSQDGFGASYQSTQTRWRYKRNNNIFTRLLTNYYKGKETSNKIHLIPIHCNIDTVNNFQFDAAKPVNSRNPMTIIRELNGVHPGTYGYYQIADMFYYWLKSMAT